MLVGQRDFRIPILQTLTRHENAVPMLYVCRSHLRTNIRHRNSNHKNDDVLYDLPSVNNKDQPTRLVLTLWTEHSIGRKKDSRAVCTF